MVSLRCTPPPGDRYRRRSPREERLQARRSRSVQIDPQLQFQDVGRYDPVEGRSLLSVEPLSRVAHLRARRARRAWRRSLARTYASYAWLPGTDELNPLVQHRGSFPRQPEVPFQSRGDALRQKSRSGAEISIRSAFVDWISARPVPDGIPRAAFGSRGPFEGES